MVDERNEEERVEAALANSATEPGAWLETIYRDEATTVLQAAYRVTGNVDDAEDVLQTVFQVDTSSVAHLLSFVQTAQFAEVCPVAG